MRLAFEHEGIQQFDKEELKSFLKDGSRRAIDVRTPEEYTEFHIPGVPLKSLQEVDVWAEELDRETPYVFICRSGARSQKVSQILKQKGFKDVSNFNGGMLSWDGETESGH